MLLIILIEGSKVASLVHCGYYCHPRYRLMFHVKHLFIFLSLSSLAAALDAWVYIPVYIVPAPTLQGLTLPVTFWHLSQSDGYNELAPPCCRVPVCVFYVCSLQHHS